jgi:hypothetical protein
MSTPSLIPYPKKHEAKYFEATSLEASKAGLDPEVAVSPHRSKDVDNTPKIS